LLPIASPPWIYGVPALLLVWAALACARQPVPISDATQLPD
jgi:hypothetical protein